MKIIIKGVWLPKVPQQSRPFTAVVREAVVGPAFTPGTRDTSGFVSAPFPRGFPTERLQPQRRGRLKPSH